MRCKGFSGLLWLMLATGLAALEPKAVAVLYNSADPESKQLAEFYAEARSIPKENLIGLEMPKQEEISRKQYDESIASPLREVFDERGWWRRGRDANGVTVPSRNSIRVLLTMRGVPLKIRQSPRADGQPHPDRNKEPFAGHDEASVDSELALLGVEGYPLEGAQRSTYFGSKVSITKAGMPHLLLTCRIDGASLQTCRRMIEDAVAVEKEGLWGMHYLDLSKKYPQGDEWIEGILKQNLKAGYPTVIDRHRETMAEGYPMGDAACYYGWYDWNLSGPMKSPDYRFERGAVAIHIHSFSAQQLRDPYKNWCAGLLERGAAVTVGNVYEPYLGLTHHLDVLHQRLLEGHCWVEASWMALPAVSWQAITLGDPLYRPFLQREPAAELLQGIHPKALTNRHAYQALHDAMKKWANQPEERVAQIKKAAEEEMIGIFWEALGLESLEAGKQDDAVSHFKQARMHATSKSVSCRQDFHIANILRSGGDKEAALKLLGEMKQAFAAQPEAKAIDTWISLLDPPPPTPKAP